MKIYTKTGDQGDTGLFAGPRVPKDDQRIETYGDVDELNAVLGLARSTGLPDEIDRIVGQIQDELFALGAELATPDPAAHGTALIDADQIHSLEKAIDHFETMLEPLRQFILPGGTPAAAQLHVARTVCRRAERRLVTLLRHATPTVRGASLVYLNRLSDLLFVLARAVNHMAKQPEIPWQKPD